MLEHICKMSMLKQWSKLPIDKIGVFLSLIIVLIIINFFFNFVYHLNYILLSISEKTK